MSEENASEDRAGTLERERRTADVRQKLLNEELNHRVRNILSLIQSLVSQPVDATRSVHDYVAALKGRIGALAQAHDQISRSDGGGSLRALVDAELLPYRAHALDIEGPPIDLDARAYAVLALVLHELTANAARFGALSTPAGAVRIAWRLDEGGALNLDWTESGGPPVTPPARPGFGAMLLRRSVPFDLGGESALTFAEGGVRARVLIPARWVKTGAAEMARDRAPARPHASTSALAGRTVLVVEDQLVIALDVEAILAAAGAGSVATAATPDEALRLLASAAPEICVLDVNLGGDTSLPVADELVRRAIPFVFATGYNDRAVIPERLSHVPVVRKPYSADGLMAAIDLALAPQS